MSEIFDIATKVSTPLALSGLFAAILFFILRQILAKEIFPRLARAAGADIIKTIVNRLFVLALVAMVLGFAGYVVGSFAPAKVADKEPAAPTPTQKRAAVNLGVNFATLSFTRLSGAETKDLDARISGQFALLELPVTIPPLEAGYGEIRLLQEQLRGHLKSKRNTLYSWYRYAFLYYGSVPLLEMMKMAKDAGDTSTLSTLKDSATRERVTLSGIEKSLAFPHNLVVRSSSINEQLLNINEQTSKEELLAIQESIVAYIDAVGDWAGTE